MITGWQSPSPKLLTHMIQIYYGDIKGDTDIYEHLLTLPNVQKRRSAFIVESELNPLSTLPLEKIDYPLQNLHYLHRGNFTR